MNKEKKEELAEMDSRWNFKKTVKIREGLNLDWDDVRKRYNNIQENHGDLHMTIAKREPPKKHRLEQLRNWYKDRFKTYNNTITFHHSQVFHWYEKLADALDVEIGEAVDMLFNDVESVRENFDLENSLVIQDVGELNQGSESQVSKEDLEEMIDND